MALLAPIRSNDEWWRNEKKRIPFVIIDPDTGLAVEDDISLWTMQWVFKASQSAASNLLLKTTATLGHFVFIPGEPKNRGYIDITAAETNALVPAGTINGWHQLKRTDAGAEGVLLYGSAVLKG